MPEAEKEGEQQVVQGEDPECWEGHHEYVKQWRSEEEGEEEETSTSSRSSLPEAPQPLFPRRISGGNFSWRC
jgi:hypothetical protein